MANRHFGKIGDIWKHLPLAEILAIEKPRLYWESHAGSARYTLTHSREQDYGVFWFYNHAPEQESLAQSAYYALLAQLANGGELTEYPGSPLIGMMALDGPSTRYLFADIDSESVETIRAAGRQLGIKEYRLNVIQGDGLSAIESAAGGLPESDLRDTVVHLDPYRPFLKSRNGLHCVDLLARLTLQGARVILWYGFDSCEYRDMLVSRAHDALSLQAPSGQAPSLWCGEILLNIFDDPTCDYVPGVLACGILCGNLSSDSRAACERLGRGLASIYEHAVLPGDHSGALRFRSEQI